MLTWSCWYVCRLIAGTYTPLCMLALDRKTATTLLLIEWGAALLGMVRSRSDVAVLVRRLRSKRGRKFARSRQKRSVIAAAAVAVLHEELLSPKSVAVQMESCKLMSSAVLFWGCDLQLDALLLQFQTLFWLSAPKQLKTAMYIFLGWVVLPYAGQMKTALGSTVRLPASTSAHFRLESFKCTTTLPHTSFSQFLPVLGGAAVRWAHDNVAWRLGAPCFLLSAFCCFLFALLIRRLPGLGGSRRVRSR